MIRLPPARARGADFALGFGVRPIGSYVMRAFPQMQLRGLRPSLLPQLTSCHAVVASFGDARNSAAEGNTATE